jgi:hypothetical protein
MRADKQVMTQMRLAMGVRRSIEHGRMDGHWPEVRENPQKEGTLQGRRIRQASALATVSDGPLKITACVQMVKGDSEAVEGREGGWLRRQSLRH